VSARLVACVLPWLFAANVAAHEIGVSQGRYERDGSTLRAELAFAPDELALLSPTLDRDRDGELDAAAWQDDAAPLRSAIAPRLALRDGTRECAAAPPDVVRQADDGVRVVLRYTCAAAGDDWRFAFTAFDALVPGHRHVATLVAAEAQATQVLHAGAAELVIPAHAVDDGPDGFTGLLAYGIEHILLGFDHLAFLLGLVALGGRGRDLLASVTAFTLAHSVTLLLAALQWVAPAADLVEPAIALSIAWVGIENLRARDPRRRWRLAFGFGLVHGFGFAGVLGETAIAPEALPASLLAFNLGVEAGQLAVLALLLPLLHLLRSSARYGRRGMIALNAGLILAGALWFLQRVAG
jgi:hypothetical protein